MSARQRMTMRASLSRNATTALNAYNTEDVADFAAESVIPCYAWNQSRAFRAPDDKVVIVEALMALVPKDADINEQDEISQIADRTGTVLFAGTLRVDTIERYPTHYELTLTRVN